MDPCGSPSYRTPGHQTFITCGQMINVDFVNSPLNVCNYIAQALLDLSSIDSYYLATITSMDIKVHFFHSTVIWVSSVNIFPPKKENKCK